MCLYCQEFLSVRDVVGCSCCLHFLDEPQAKHVKRVIDKLACPCKCLVVVKVVCSTSLTWSLGSFRQWSLRPTVSFIVNLYYNVRQAKESKKIKIKIREGYIQYIMPCDQITCILSNVWYFCQFVDREPMGHHHKSGNGGG